MLLDFLEERNGSSSPKVTLAVHASNREEGGEAALAESVVAAAVVGGGSTK